MEQVQAVSTLQARDYRTGRPVQLEFESGLIKTVKPLSAPERESLPWIGPGLADLQINGYRGMDFNTFPLEAETVVRVTRALWEEGVTAYYPTVITNGDKEIEQAVRTIAEVCEADSMINDMIKGIHLEGPFISPQDGPRGAHAKEHVKQPSWPLFEKWQEAAHGKIRLVTLSPEWPQSADFIRNCTAWGIAVSIGHTAAAPEEIQAAVSAGARMSTHLGNGSHVELPRHSNYVWEQLADDRLAASFIADGFHLPPSFLKVALRAKGANAMLVSDAVSLSGMKPGVYDLHIGGKVVLTEEGKLHLADNPKILAGSAQMLAWGINRLLEFGLCSLNEAWNMASIRPAAFMGLASGLVEGAPADLTLFDYRDNQVRITETFKAGQRVYIA